MKRTLILLGLFLGLLMLYFVFFFDRQNSTLCKESIDFAVEEVENIRKISLRQVVEGEEEENIILEKQASGDWTYNGGYNALELRVETLLETLRLIRVRRTLSESSQEKAQDLIDRNHIRVEIFSDEGLMVAYQVGPQTKDLQGTVMRMLGDTPFWCEAQAQVVHIPGVQGYLNSRYTLDFELWRENLLFDARPASLSRIQISYQDDPAQSVTLLKQDDRWALQGVESPVDSQALADYLGLFQGKVYGESFAEKYFPNYLDTLRTRPADITYTLTDPAGEVRRLFLYEREDNLNNYFGYVEGEEELITVQRFVFDKYLQKREDFLFSF